MSDQQTEYALVIRPEGPGVPGIQRLKGVLKECLRKYGMRCVELREIKPCEPSGGLLDGGYRRDDGGANGSEARARSR